MEQQNIPRLIVEEDGTLRIEGDVISYDFDATHTEIAMFRDGFVPKDCPPIVIVPEVLYKFPKVDITGGLKLYQNKEQMLEDLSTK
ncbi:MAG: hypothetical protein LUF01_14475 [Bacteroides sp.]|nr:hypothetical protein [Bacteroides sp.]